MFTRVLAATDFSASSEAALDCAERIAAQFCGTLHVLHVVDDPSLANSVAFRSEIYLSQSETSREADLREARQRLALHVAKHATRPFATTAHVVVGVPAATIAAYAKANGFDLIVLGTHGRTGLAHVVMGSVAEQVIRTAACPVLMVPSPPALVPAGERRRVRVAVPE